MNHRPSPSGPGTDRRIRLLIGTEYLNEGGVGRQIHYLVNHIDPDTFDTHLAVLRRRHLFFRDLFETSRVKAFLLDGGRGVGPRSWIAMARAFRALRPHIVHLFGGKANHIGALARIFSPVPVMIFSVRTARPSVVNDLVYRLLRSRQDLTVVNSEETRRLLVGRSGYHREGVLLEPNFLDTERFRALPDAERQRARRDFLFEDGRICLATIGRLAPQKNQLAVVEAMGRLRDEGRLPADLVYLMVGRPYDRRYASRVVTRRQDLGLEGVCRILEPTDRIVELYNALDGIFQPSTCEGLSNVVIEAQACGVPVALSREGDNDDLLSGGRAGIPFSAADRTDLGRALLDLYRLARQSERREEITGTGRREAVRRFSLAKGVRRLEAIYRDLLPPGGVKP